MQPSSRSRARPVALLDGVQELQAREPRHADVGNQHFGGTAGERVERILRGGNELNAMPSRLSAFSITQRMERSSSTIQTGFMSAAVGS